MVKDTGGAWNNLWNHQGGLGRDYDPRVSSTFADFCTAMGGLLQVAKVPGILTVCYDSVRVEIRLGWEVRKWAN